MSTEEDLIAYSDEEIEESHSKVAAKNRLEETIPQTSSEKKGSYVGIHSTGFKDFLLKPELQRAIVDCGFEHPSEGMWFLHNQIVHTKVPVVQQVCIPQAILGTDALCQAKSGLGKTAVFVLSTLQQLDPIAGETSVLIMGHTRELAYQISKEYERFTKYMPDVRVKAFFGGTALKEDIEKLGKKETHPHIIVGTPGRLNALVRDKHLWLGGIKVFVLDECDKMLEQVGIVFFVLTIKQPGEALTNNQT